MLMQYTIACMSHMTYTCLPSATCTPLIFHMDAKIDCVQCISQLFGAFMLNSHHQDVSVFLLGDPYTVTLHLSLLGNGANPMTISPLCQILFFYLLELPATRVGNVWIVPCIKWLYMTMFAVIYLLLLLLLLSNPRLYMTWLYQKVDTKTFFSSFPLQKNLQQNTLEN